MNVFPTPLLPVLGNTVSFYRYAILDKCTCESVKKWKVLNIDLFNFVLFHSSNDFVTTKWFILQARGPVMLDHKMWWVSQKEDLPQGQKLFKHFLKILHTIIRVIQVYEHLIKDNDVKRGKIDANNLLWHIFNVSLWSGKLHISCKQLKSLVLNKHEKRKFGCCHIFHLIFRWENNLGVTLIVLKNWF